MLMTMYIRTTSLAILVCQFAATAVHAQYYGPPAGYGPPNGPFASGSGEDDGFGPGGASFRGGLGFDFDKATRYRTIHGILAALAFVVLFPIGAIAMRVVPGRLALWLHAITQLLAYVCFVGGAALGIWLVQEIRIPFAGGSLLNIASINYHPIIGLIVLVALFFQPVLGFIHHLQFKRLRRRQIWSYLHLWNGRLMLLLGIINGGLGLHIAGASRQIVIAYAVVAGVSGGLWILVALTSEARRGRTNTKTQVTRLSSMPAAGGSGEWRARSAVKLERSRDNSQSS